MQVSRISHYVRRACEVGLYQTQRIARERARSWLFDRYWRSLAHCGKAANSWDQAARALGVSISLDDFVAQNIAGADTFLTLRASVMPTFDRNELIAAADAYAHGTFDLLGSGSITFGDAIAWRKDFRLAAQAPHADVEFPLIFYKDMEITIGRGDTITKDIKVPWELSRLQHFFTVGCAYQETGDDRYALAFSKQLFNWIEQNPFLLGPNWVCPMDVGIRAINLVWAFFLFSRAPECNDARTRIPALLYDHLIFLENNWEVYDGRTSNHYLSDLVGYLYCCYFFKDSPIAQEKFAWCRAEIIAEMEKQIFAEGTDYEGSTRYHVLVTELFYHAALITRLAGNPLPDTNIAKLDRMFEFIAWCTPRGGRLVTIGDNDSGKVVCGITPEVVRLRVAGPQSGPKEYPEFGISIVKTDDWHVTLRQHAYKKRQPSGHFHNDVGSVTISFRGIPIFVDPGSYLYTPSAKQRNLFRSVEAHNTFWPVGIEPVDLADDRLFSLDLPENWYVPDSHNNPFSMQMQHELLTSRSLIAQRKVVCEPEKGSITISDTWKPASSSDRVLVIPTCWNFTLDSCVLVEQHSATEFTLTRGTDRFLFQSEIPLFIEKTAISHEYGSKTETLAIRAKKDDLLTLKPIVWRILRV